MKKFSLEKLSVNHYRNLENINLEFSKFLTCIFGENGHGKTNILEAIYLLNHNKSFRKKTSFQHFISLDVDNPKTYINGSFHLNDSRTTSSKNLALEIRSDDETIYYADGELKKRSFKGPIAFIDPYDGHHFFLAREQRIQWLDNSLAMYDGKHKTNLASCYKLLRFRNEILRKAQFEHLSADDKLAIHVFEKEIAKKIVVIHKARQFFVDNLCEYVEKIFKQLFDKIFSVKIQIESKLEEFREEKIKNQLELNRDKETIRQRIVLGPHLDDISLFLNGLLAQQFASLGQQKMIYFSLIFGFIEFLKEKQFIYPLILIDDVSGELDQVRWSTLLAYLDQIGLQIILTTANENFKNQLLSYQNVTHYHICEGRVEK